MLFNSTIFKFDNLSISDIESGIMDLGKKGALAYKQKSDSPNSCWGRYVQFGKRSPQLDASLRIGHALMEASFFNELRTKQQLGYIVHSGLKNYEKVLGMLFLIQSSDYDPYQVDKRVEDWTKQMLQSLDKLDDKEFSTYQEAVVKMLQEEDKTIAERHGTLYFDAVVLEGEFGYTKRVEQAAKDLTKTEVIKVLRSNLDKYFY